MIEQIDTRDWLHYRVYIRPTGLLSVNPVGAVELPGIAPASS
jgi:hypothetical protein